MVEMAAGRRVDSAPSEPTAAIDDMDDSVNTPDLFQLICLNPLIDEVGEILLVSDTRTSSRTRDRESDVNSKRLVSSRGMK